MNTWDGETRIEQMDLEQVKAMLCPLSGHDPLKCIGCNSVQGCPAGQRVNVLIEEETKARHPNNNKVKKQLEVMATCRKALESPDPIEYISQVYGNNYKAARQLLSNWSKRYPELFKGFKLPTQTESRLKMEKAGENIETALKSGDVYGWYMKHCRMGKARVDRVIQNALKHKPELQRYLDGAVKPEETPEEPQEGEISVEDFLNTVETPENPAEIAQEPPCDDEVEDFYVPDEEAQETGEKPQETVEPSGGGDMRSSLIAKGEELAAKRDEIRRQIAALEDQLKWVQENMDAVARVMNLFDPNTAIARSLTMG